MDPQAYTDQLTAYRQSQAWLQAHTGPLPPQQGHVPTLAALWRQVGLASTPAWVARRLPRTLDVAVIYALGGAVLGCLLLGSGALVCTTLHALGVPLQGPPHRVALTCRALAWAGWLGWMALTGVACVWGLWLGEDNNLRKEQTP